MHTLNVEPLTPEFLAAIASRAKPSSPFTGFAPDQGQIALCNAKFQANLEFYGRMLMALFHA